MGTEGEKDNDEGVTRERWRDRKKTMMMLLRGREMERESRMEGGRERERATWNKKENERTTV